MRARILKLLRDAKGGYVSGEGIAEKLGVSRTAIWKHVKALREAGYGIASRTRSGYSLREAPDLLIPGEVRSGLSTEIIGRRVTHYDKIGSTNAVAKRLASKGAKDGTVVVAEEQDAGRGRLERSFFCPKGGIWFSVILRPSFMPHDAPKCTLMAAVAVAEAMGRFGVRAGIKWPNDILAEGRKISGILTEMSAEIDRIRYVVIGIGINVNIGADEFPPDVREIATSMSIMRGKNVPRAAFFRAVLEEMERLYLSACSDGFGPMLAAWRAHSVTLGRRVRVIGVDQGDVFEGMAVDIDEDGAWTHLRAVRG